MIRTSSVLLACALVLAAVAAWSLWRIATEKAPPALDAAAVEIGGPFALTDQNGHAMTDKDLHGRWTLLYFGYTFCPDVCPTTLALMQNTMRKLGAKADRITPVFITVDPERDTPSALKTYLESFGPRFVGLTGKPDAIAKVARAYRVYYAKHPLEGGGYSVDHSSVIYLLDPSGKFVKVYEDTITAQALADDLKAQL